MANKNEKCINCGTLAEGKFCPDCGQKMDEKRFTFSTLPEEFLHGFFHVHHGLFFTIKELFIRPGEMLRGYIAGKRIVYFNPFTFLVLISLAGGFMFAMSGFSEHVKGNILATRETIIFTRNHFSYRMLLTIPTYAIMCWVVFRSYKYNLAEHLIINTFLISQGFVILTGWLIVFFIMNPSDLLFQILYFSSFSTVILYQIIVLYAMFNRENIVMRWIKSAVVVITGLVLSFVLMNMLSNFL